MYWTAQAGADLLQNIQSVILYQFKSHYRCKQLGQPLPPLRGCRHQATELNLKITSPICLGYNSVLKFVRRHLPKVEVSPPFRCMVKSSQVAAAKDQLKRGETSTLQAIEI